MFKQTKIQEGAKKALMKEIKKPLPPKREPESPVFEGKVKSAVAQIKATKAREESREANSFGGMIKNTVKAIPGVVKRSVTRVADHIEGGMKKVEAAKEANNRAIIERNDGSVENYKAKQKEALKKAIKPK